MFLDSLVSNQVTGYALFICIFVCIVLCLSGEPQLNHLDLTIIP